MNLERRVEELEGKLLHKAGGEQLHVIEINCLPGGCGHIMGCACYKTPKEYDRVFSCESKTGSGVTVRVFDMVEKKIGAVDSPKTK